MNVFGAGRDARFVVDRIAERVTERHPKAVLGTVPA
jgi:hypothetical protein